MDEKTVTMMEGVAREWRVRVKDSAGNVLNPEGFSFYGAAADGMQVPRRMQVHVEGDVAVLRLPGLWMSGRCWRYQVMCQDVLTGVEWVLCQGDVVMERRVACNGPALHEDAVLVDVVLDSELYQVDVYLGDSTAATAEAARLAEAAREGAEAGAARSVDAAAKAEALKGVALDAAAKAALSAEGAADSKRGAEAAAVDAAADAQLAEVAAAEAEASREAAEAEAKLARARAAEAEAGAKVAMEAVSDALAARDEAEAAQRGAEAAQVVAEDASAQAGRYAEQAVGASDGAVVAQGKAEAAQGVAEAKAAEAVAAAEAVLQPESIAAQAARPATMVLVKDELLALLGDASLFDIDTDGQKIIVHTDRLADDQLAAVEDMLGRFVPQFIEVERYNHHIEVSWRDLNKYAACKTWADCYNVDPEKHDTGQNYGNNFYYTRDLTSDGDFAYPLTNIQGTHISWGLSYFNYVTIDPFSFEFKNASSVRTVYTAMRQTELHLSAPNATEAIGAFRRNAQLVKVKAYLPKATHINDFCADSPNVRVVECDFPAASTASNAFPCKLEKASALRILNSVPAYTSGSHPLTIGIHVDHQHDEEVLASIANAESKGWTLAVQWNGTPTSQAATTYGLRKPPICARVGEMENGERCLDWGHYVTDLTGYEEFRSVEAAREYYGLTEEDLTETE